MTDKATHERLEKDVDAVKNDIAALTDQITDALNCVRRHRQKTGSPRLQPGPLRAEETMDDMSERGSAMFDAAHDAATSLEESLEDVVTQRPLATIALALGIGFLIGAAWRR